ncbi:MAG: hypothetical protein ACR2G2_11730 [Pseudonocardia sp.]
MDPTANAAPGGLRLQPNMIPRLTRVYQEALDQLAPVLADAKDGYRIDQDAMGDAASTRFQTAFNQYASDGAGSVREQVTAFERRLRATVDKLAAIQRDGADRPTVAGGPMAGFGAGEPARDRDMTRFGRWIETQEQTP